MAAWQHHLLTATLCTQQWLNGPASGLLISRVIVRDTMADGLNLHTGWSNVTVRLSKARSETPMMIYDALTV